MWTSWRSDCWGRGRVKVHQQYWKDLKQKYSIKVIDMIDNNWFIQSSDAPFIGKYQIQILIIVYNYISLNDIINTYIYWTQYIELTLSGCKFCYLKWYLITYNCNKQWMQCREWIDAGKKWHKWVHTKNDIKVQCLHDTISRIHSETSHSRPSQKILYKQWLLKIKHFWFFQLTKCILFGIWTIVIDFLWHTIDI